MGSDPRKNKILGRVQSDLDELAAPKARSKINITYKRGPESEPDPTKKNFRLGEIKNKILEPDPDLGDGLYYSRPHRTSVWSSNSLRTSFMSI